MTQFSNAMEVFHLLPKTNCRKCNEQTCLAFASKVFLSQKKLELCPYVSAETVEKYSGNEKKESLVEIHQKEILAALMAKIKACDLADAAKRTGGECKDGKLTIRIFGKPFSINNEGRMFSDIHINPWITSTVLGYVLECEGVPLTGEWVPFRELKGGREKNGLFVQRSEASFKQIADRYTGLFEDLIVIFNGRETNRKYDSDISLILHPLPRIPMLVCYWKPEDGMESQLNLFFDRSADQNANIDIIYSIGAGIVVMFEKLSLRHGTE